MSEKDKPVVGHVVPAQGGLGEVQKGLHTLANADTASWQRAEKWSKLYRKTRDERDQLRKVVDAAKAMVKSTEKALESVKAAIERIEREEDEEKEGVESPGYGDAVMD